MNRLSNHRRSLMLGAVLLPLMALFIYVLLRSGPLAPVPVTVTTVEHRSITPALFGIGTVESRYTYRIGPTIAGRVQRVDVQVGDRVRAGQALGEMDPVDLDERIAAQEATLKRTAAAIQAAEARVSETSARFAYAGGQAARYEALQQAGSASKELVEAKQQERQVAEAGLAVASSELDAARQELARASADRDALLQLRANLQLLAPVDGLVVARNTEPGSTVVAGQAVVEIIDPNHLWINVRFNQLNASGLRAELPALIVLRSRTGHSVPGRVLRLEPLADVVTEELLAKVVFDALPESLPPVGELAEVTIALPALPTAPVLPGACVHRVRGNPGVWLLEAGGLRFVPVKLGATDLDGTIQILEGVKTGDRVVVYSQRALKVGNRVKLVERLPGVPP